MAAANDSRLSEFTGQAELNEISRIQTTTTSTSTNGSSNGAQSTSPRAHAVGSDNDNIDKAKRKRQPRNSACQSCAALKMKCIATSTLGVCERCSRMGRDCVPAVPKPRKRRATDGFESKGISLSDLIDRDSPRPEAYVAPQRSFASVTDTSQIDAFESRSLMHTFAQGLAIDDRAAEYLLKGVDLTYVRRCIGNFNHMAAAFPFVSVPHADAKTMITRRPLTTIAICTVASASQHETQSRLSEAFRQSLATRCIIDGERSLDILVGLLIYLSWHHQYYRKQQIYQKLCLLAGMAIDLGIKRIPSLAEQSRSVDQETQQAFIGVYYLTTSLSLMGFKKPSPLAWSPSLDHFASSVYSSTSREINLQPYIDLAHLLEDHAQLLSAAPPVQSAAYIDLATKAALSRLRTLKRIHQNASSISAYAAVAIHINAQSLTANTSSMMISGSPLMQTAVALKDYLDELLLRPPSALHQVAIVDWTNLLEMLVLISRLSSPDFISDINNATGSTIWDSSALASMLQPDAVLDAVCSHMAAASVQESRNEGLLSWLRGMCDSMKRKIATERNGTDESCFETISNLDRARRNSHAGHDNGRFRAVNPDTNNSPRKAPWSEFTYDLLGGVGVLDESFWSAYSNFGSR